MLDVSIKAAARLPEKPLGSLAAPPCNSWQPLGRVLRQMANSPSTDRLLDRLAKVSHRVVQASGVDDEVDMFRHENVRPEREVECRARVVDRFCQPLAGTIRFQKLKSPVTTESKFVRIAGLIKGLTPALSLAVIHGSKSSRGGAVVQEKATRPGLRRLSPSHPAAFGAIHWSRSIVRRGRPQLVRVCAQQSYGTDGSRGKVDVRLLGMRTLGGSHGWPIGGDLHKDVPGRSSVMVGLHQDSIQADAPSAIPDANSSLRCLHQTNQ